MAKVLSIWCIFKASSGRSAVAAALAMRESSLSVRSSRLAKASLTESSDRRSICMAWAPGVILVAFLDHRRRCLLVLAIRDDHLAPPAG